MKQKLTFKTLIQKIDKNILLFLSALLLVVIPLYPKLPLFDIIPGYIVRVRIEDFLVLFTVIVFIVQLLRKKIEIKTPLTTIIALYAAVGFLSTISGIFVTGTIPTSSIHIMKSFLHYFRYLEYFTVFFIIQAAVKTRKDLRLLIKIILLTLLAVGIYGLGQKYLYWPVYSTMNREFSKGIRLYLTEHARVQSTFGGHYDMAGYLVILMPFLLLFSFITKKKIAKLFLWLLFSLSTWLMILSAARTSFIAMLAGVYLSIFLASMLEKNWKERISKLFTRTIASGLIILIMFNAFGDSIAERIFQSLEAYPQVTMVIEVYKDSRDYATDAVNDLFSSQTEMIVIEKPDNGLSTDQAAVLIASDTTPSPIRPGDVYVDVPNKIRVATVSATGETEYIIIEIPRVYSENALKHGLSLAIRLDTLWPQAIAGFYKNPALGSGYATLTKETTEQFTEAESTDNNFLRTLGEIGLLGFITFYGAVAIALFHAFKMAFNKKSDKLKKTFAIGYIGASVGLLLNAIFIDVYAASKVAFTFWAMTGILIALLNMKDVVKPVVKIKKKTKRKTKGKFSNTPKKKVNKRP